MAPHTMPSTSDILTCSRTEATSMPTRLVTWARLKMTAETRTMTWGLSYFFFKLAMQMPRNRTSSKMAGARRGNFAIIFSYYKPPFFGLLDYTEFGHILKRKKWEIRR